MDLLGCVSPFDGTTDNVAEYIDRFDRFLGANEVDDDWKVNLFLAVIGPQNFKILKELCHPTKLNVMSYDELKDKLKKHFEPKPIVIAERYKFWAANQGQEESVAQFVERLKNISSTCKFGSFLENALLDKLLCGLHSRFYSVKMHLLNIHDLTFEVAEAKCLEEEAHVPYNPVAENLGNENILSSSVTKRAYNAIQKWDSMDHTVSIHNVPFELNSKSDNSEMDSSLMHCSVGTPLDQFLSMEECLELIMSFDEADALPKIPDGIKSNVYFVINMAQNIERKRHGKKMLFIDDCGCWHRNKKASLSRFRYIINSTNNYRLVSCIKGSYYVPKRDGKKISWVPFKEQPDPENILIMNRYYASSAVDSNYRRRISWFEFPDSFLTKKSLGVVEYLGVYPGGAPHGNSKVNKRDYIRASPESVERKKMRKLARSRQSK